MKIAICLFGGIGTKESLGRSTNKKFQDIEYIAEILHNIQL